MIRYESTSQLTIEEFKTPSRTYFLTDNRWFTSSKIVQWDRVASIYISKMDSAFGRLGVCLRVVLVTLIIKHKSLMIKFSFCKSKKIHTLNSLLG